MANPQCENGFTKIANELLEALCHHRINGESMQVLFSIMRKTYGYKKTEDWVSNSQLVEMTGLTKGNVSRSLSKLITNKIVIKTDNKLRVNKNYDEWIVIKIDNRAKVIKKETKVIKSDTVVIKNDNNSYQKRGTQKIKETITKETIKDMAIPSPDKRNIELQSLMDFSKSKQFSLQGSTKQNRQYAYNLLRKKDDKGVALGLERVKWLVEVALNCRGVPYAPQVNDFKSMFYKWQDLLSNAQKEKNERDNRKSIIG